MLLPALGGNVPREPRGDRSRITGNDGRIREPLAEFPGDDLRLHGLILAGAALFHQLPPFGSFLLRVFQEATMTVAVQ